MGGRVDTCLGAATVAKLWCPGMVVCPLWWNDAIASSCYLSASHDQDSERIGCESEGTWFYGTTMIFGWRNCADSYESAICGFLDGGIALNLGVI